MSTQIIQQDPLQLKIYQVSEVNRLARNSLEQLVVWVEGEISECRKNPNYNFYYLTLRDDKAVLPCLADGVVLKSIAGDPIGQKVLVKGYLTIYEPRGQFQLKIKIVEAVGEGLLRRKLEELIFKLRIEGLFDPKHKQPIPLFPKRVCIVTSYNSDAFNDFKRHTIDKFRVIELFYADVRVQGSSSVGQLLEMLPKVDSLNFDVVVITRGGGSLEDLAAFNDEKVARLIFKMKTPTVVAIGHEANESLAEWVADRRASTPTDAASIITEGYRRIEDKLDFGLQKLISLSNYYFASNFQRLDLIHVKIAQVKQTFAQFPQKLARIKETLKRHESILVLDAQKSLSNLMNHLRREMAVLQKSNDQKLQNLAKSLSLLSYENTLKRGFSITTDDKGKVIRSIKNVAAGDLIGVRLADGKISSIVKSKSK